MRRIKPHTPPLVRTPVNFISPKVDNLGEYKEIQSKLTRVSHDVSSQHDTITNKDSNISLSTSSQKGVDIEKRSQLRVHNIEGDTILKNITSHAKEENSTRAHGEHTLAQLKTLSSDVEPFVPSLDASQTNVEMQPHSLSITLFLPHTTSQISSNIFMINNMEMSNSPSFKLTGEPKLNIDTHQSEKTYLFECQSFVSNLVVDTVLENQKKLSQLPSTDVITSTDNTSTVNPSMDIPYPLTNIPSMDVHHPSMNIPSTINVVLSDSNLQILSDYDTYLDEQMVISTLLSLSEGDKISERLCCSQTKGENESEKHLISSKVVSETEGEGSNLDDDAKGEKVRIVRHDEILIQKQRKK